MLYTPIKNEAIGETIQNLRRSRGLTQEVFSGLAGIARSHLAMIENGTKIPNFDTICRIAEALDIKPSVLVSQIEDASVEYHE